MGTILPALSLNPKVPVVFTRHIFNERVKKDIYHRMIFKRLDAIFAISDFIKENMLRTYPVKASKVPIVYNGVDTSRFKPDHKLRKVIRNKFNIKDDDFVLGFAGRLDEAKGLSELIDAFNMWIKHDDVSQKLLIVGEETRNTNSNYRNCLIKKINELSLVDRIIFTGFSDNPQNELNAMDTFVMPSWKESFGMVATEAMCTGIPIIISDSGSANEIICNNKYGLSFKTKDPKSLFNQIKLLFYNSELRNEYAQKGMKFALENFSKERHIIRTLELYYKLIEDRN
jgi:glycosyltransferase involved in cell wall biosynthesis